MAVHASRLAYKVFMKTLPETLTGKMCHALPLLLLLLFLTPVLNSRGMKKLRYAIQKVQKSSLLLLMPVLNSQGMKKISLCNTKKCKN